NLLPLLLAALAWFVVGNWVVRLLIMVLYLLCIVPYGFFVAMPLMVRLFQHPASLHRRRRNCPPSAPIRNPLRPGFSIGHAIINLVGLCPIFSGPQVYP